MRSLSEHLALYSSYHRDGRNRLTHFFGVPIIIFSLLLVAGLARVPSGNTSLSLAEGLCGVFGLYYMWLHRWLGRVLFLLLVLLTWATETIVRNEPQSMVLTISAVTFIGGWALQLLGHRIEGNKPALLDNLAQIFVAPIFLVAEAAFALGLCRSLRADVERRIDTGDFRGSERVRRTVSARI